MTDCFRMIERHGLDMSELKKADFYFDLPEELIAQDPLEDRSSSRLLMLDKKTGEVEHHIFYNLLSSQNYTLPVRHQLRQLNNVPSLYAS